MTNTNRNNLAYRRFIVQPWDGATGRMYLVIDQQAPEWDQPYTVANYRNHEEAYRHAEGLNIVEGNTRAH